MKNNQKGSSLIAVCFLIIVFSAAGVYLIGLQEKTDTFTKQQITNEKELYIKDAILTFAQENGRYPCPAPINADFDEAEFGLSPDDGDAGTPEYECVDAPIRDADGEFVVDGRLGSNVRVGAVPVRTLNIPDKYIADAYGTRFVYAMTESYGNQDFMDAQPGGAITITDSSEVNHITSQPGTAIFALITPRGDGNGSFDKNGNLISVCNDTGLSGENCDYQIGFGDANFISSSLKSDNHTDDENYYTHTMEFAAEDCPAAFEADPFADVTFIVDSSRSMRSRLPSRDCPEETGTRCSRIEVARWALRTIVPQVIMKDYEYAASEGEEVSDSINIARFMNNRIWLDQPNPTVDDILANDEMDEINFNEDLMDEFEDSALGPMTEDDFVAIEEAVDNQLRFCPDGGTPLGQHVEAITQATYKEPEETGGRPNKIVVLTDGIHDGGDDYLLETVRDRLAADMDNVEIDYIDMTGRNSDILEAGLIGENARVYNGTDPEALINAFAASLRTCGGAVSTNERAVDETVFCGDVREPRVRPPGWEPPVRPPPPPPDPDAPPARRRAS